MFLMRREMVLDIIRKNPGIGFNAIARQTKLSNGVLSHYILKLLKEKEIMKTGVRAKYFLKKIPEKDREIITILKNPTNLKIIKALLERDPLKSKDIVKIIGKSVSTISISLKKMEKENIISRKIMNQESKLTSDIGYTVSDKEFMRKIFSKYL